MKARIVILPSGEVSLYADEGTPEQAVAKLQALIHLLTQSGVQIEMINPPEQHRHAPDGEHLPAGTGPVRSEP